mmetsp:Transcript_120706/g.341983  ORF Transcript_120706/g.341983 Transcript_120706/m.341983 type:complete len:389 (-) Transcript_120706:117-1283(-)
MEADAREGARLEASTDKDAAPAPTGGQHTPRRMVGKGPPAGEQSAREAFLQEWGPLGLTASSADYYFNSYNHYGVHEDVLKDAVTTSAYQRAIKQNAHLFRGAVVLDVCAGLGLCSLLAAQAGAKRVIALESQPELVAMGSRVSVQNGFGPDVLTFVRGDAGSLERLPDDLGQVDIIVSEWMGYFLMYEARIAEVVRARDRWLKPGGLLFPDRAKLYVGMLEDGAYKDRHFDFYGNVWGFDFSAMKAAAHSEPVVNSFEQAQLLSSSACILDLDLYRCTGAECFEMASTFQISCKRDGTAHATLCWFEIRFDACHKPIAFVTGPESPPTCWKQTAFFLAGVPPTVKAGDKVKGMIAVRKASEARRAIDIKISCRINSGKSHVQFYRWS